MPCIERRRRTTSPAPETRGFRLLLLFLAGLALAPHFAAAKVASFKSAGGGELFADIDGEGRLRVQATTLPGDGWWRLTARVGLPPSRWAEVAAANGNSQGPEVGAMQELPTSLWPRGLGERALRSLYPADRPQGSDWLHVVSAPSESGRSESPWSIAVLFTGQGSQHTALTLPARGLRPGDEVLIPSRFLLPELRPHGEAGESERSDAAQEPRSETGTTSEPVAETGPESTSRLSEAPAAGAIANDSSPAASEEEEGRAGASRPEDFVVPPGTTTADGQLEFGVDDTGPHAIYRLKLGETLYSDVVLRFTGRLGGAFVNETALSIAERSAIADVTNIRVGQRIVIPLSELRAEFLPPGHPRREEMEAARRQSAGMAHVQRRKGLSGVHVIIDTGHGGRDPGARSGKVWEDDYVYDVVCRVMALLADSTLATVHPLVQDTSSEHLPLPRISLDRDEVLLTDPVYPLTSTESTAVAVNLRWLLSNDIRRGLLKKGVKEEQLVFMSLHADSLHESARGSMVYFPDSKYRQSRKRVPVGASYRRHAEARSANGFHMTKSQLLRSEGLSRRLGEKIIGAIREAGLPVHGFSPVRGHVMRKTAWIPAVLRYNRVPCSILLEACNLNNGEDQLKLRDPVFRQELAEAIVAGLLDYFSGSPASEG